MPVPTDEERIGTLVADRYRIEGVLGRGGMGAVFEAMHTWTGRAVAIKLLAPELAENAAGVRRFFQEARAAATIRHPNVVEVLDMGAAEDGCVFLVLELLHGEPLSRRLDARGRLPAGEALALLLPIAQGLGAAHEQGILHRDVKPDNIFISRDGAGAIVPKLLDFGMAKMAESNWGLTTARGTLLGTTFYMSPEQCEGARDLGFPTDVWSIGAVLYRCLTGRPPFVGRSPTTVLLAITRGEREPLRSLAPETPPAIASAIEAALEPDRAQRYPDMGALIAALLRAAEESGVLLDAGECM